MVRRSLFIDKPADDLLDMGNKTIHSDEAVSQNDSRVSDPVCNLIQKGGLEGGTGLIPIEVLLDDSETLSVGLVGDTSLQ